MDKPVGNKNDEYRARAAECQRKAKAARNESDKRCWLDMADAWLAMIRSPRQAACDLGAGAALRMPDTDA